MATNLPRPTTGACVRVKDTIMRDHFDRSPSTPDSHAGEHGIVIGFDVPSVFIPRDGAPAAEASWDIGVAFLGGAASAYDMNEVEITHDGPGDAFTRRPASAPGGHNRDHGNADA